MFDADNNGFIEMKELETIFAGTNNTSIRNFEKVWKTIMEEADKNGDN